MALKDGVRIKETTTTTGTGTLNLAGAVTGFTTFVSEIVTTNTCFYLLVDANLTGWECGIGTVTSGSPDTLARTTVLRSTNANAAISLSAGTHTVVNYIVPGYATGDMNFQDLILQRPEFKDYSETVSNPSISAGALTLNIENGNVFNVTWNANITSLVIQNPSLTGKACSFTLYLTNL